jgi:L-rhamnose isomerase
MLAGDDVTGFEDIEHPLGGGLLATGNFKGKAYISMEVFGTDIIKRVEIVKNNKIILRKNSGSIDIKYEAFDNENLKKGDFYYLRIIQKNGEMAWSSPIFVD